MLRGHQKVTLNEITSYFRRDKQVRSSGILNDNNKFSHRECRLILGGSAILVLMFHHLQADSVGQQGLSAVKPAPIHQLRVLSVHTHTPLHVPSHTGSYVGHQTSERSFNNRHGFSPWCCLVLI
ncbi:hypothetical protein AN958_02321 [Leucoagaricus sp. SymC.cos]|nr:hypothetical protein AN958_02321 [Leucoagaricus sp. SymC.cos]